MRIGIFGGTFNPVHNGHINLVNRICEKVSLDMIYVIPTKIPPHKIAPQLASGDDRLNMLKLAFEDNPLVKVSDYELLNKGKSYTIFTLLHIKEKFPDAELFLLMGSDMFVTLHEWKRYKEIYTLAHIVVVSRNSEDKDDICSYMPFAEQDGAECIVIDIEPMDISSTAIRTMIAEGQDFSCYLPKKVVEYIGSFNLYSSFGKCLT